MPSKIYGVLASGTATLAIADEDGDTCRLVQENQLGMIAFPDRVDQIKERLIWAMSHSEMLSQLAKRARPLATTQYDRSICHQRFREQLSVA